MASERLGSSLKGYVDAVSLRRRPRATIATYV